MIELYDEYMEKYSNDSEYDSLALNIGGTLKKNFVRVKSESIKDFLDKITKENNSYVTYLDDLIKSSDFDNSKEFPLEYVSCMLKDASRHFGAYNICEVWGSRIANALGVPTVFNENVSLNKQTNILSIDCVKPNTHISTLKTKYYQYIDYKLRQIKCHCFSDFDDWENLFDACIRNKRDLTDDEELNNLLIGVDFVDYPFDRETLDECVAKFKKDFVKQYLLRVVILHDKDFYPANLMVVTDETTGKFSVGPCFDYEFIFNDFSWIPDTFYTDNLKYIMRKYPNEAMKFANAVFNAFFENGVVSQQKLQTIFGDTTSDFIKSKQDCLIKNLNQFASCYLENIDYINKRKQNFVPDEQEL